MRVNLDDSITLWTQAPKRTVALRLNCKTGLIFGLWRTIRQISKVTSSKIQFIYVVIIIVIAFITVSHSPWSFNRAPNVFFRCIILYPGKNIWLWLIWFSIHEIWINHVMFRKDIFPMGSEENTFQTCRDIAKNIRPSSKIELQTKITKPSSSVY